MKSKAKAKITGAKVIADDCAEIVVRKGKMEYTVNVYASADGINFTVVNEDGIDFDFQGPEYDELDGEE